MSGFTADSNTTGLPLSSNPFTETEKDLIRYYCGWGQGVPMTGSISFTYYTKGDLLEKKMQIANDINTTRVRQFLANLVPLENALYGTTTGISQNLDTAEAGVWKRNPKEYRERKQLYLEYRLELCHYLQLPGFGPDGPGVGLTCVV